MFSFAWRLKPTLAYGFSVLGDRWSTLNVTDKEVSMHTGRSGLKETHENGRFTLQHWRLLSSSHNGNSLLGSLGGHFHVLPFYVPWTMN